MAIVPRSFNKPVDASDARLRARLTQQAFPFSQTPFIKADDKFDEATLRDLPEEEPISPRTEAVHEWLELFYDLAWTATFSGLSQGTPIKGLTTVASFCVFFVMAWWLWVSQVIYDTKFFVNDWWHRIIVLLQFFMFGVLCSFTSGFDVTVGFSAVTAPSEIVQVVYVNHAFAAISLVFCVSRVILAVEYFRVISYAKKRNVKGISVYTCCLLLSAALFLGASVATLTIDNTNDYDEPGRAISKFVLWGAAIIVEAVGYVMTSMPRGLLSQGSLPRRLAALTTVIIGEGINGFIEPLTSTVRGVGFNGKVGVQIIVTFLVIFLIFLIYFQSFDSRNARTVMRQKFVIITHFPVQLCIILLLEGLKSILNLTTFSNSLDFFFGLYDTRDHFLTDMGADGDFINLFAELGLDLLTLRAETLQASNESVNVYFPLNATQLMDFNVTLKDVIFDQCEGRLVAAAIEQVLKTYKVLDDNQTNAFDTYIHDAKAPGPALDTFGIYNTNVVGVVGLGELIDQSFDQQYAPAKWIPVAGGVFLLFLALTMLCNGLWKNRYSWWSFMSRIVGGVSICLLATINTNGDTLQTWVDVDWFLPTFALCYASVFATDYVISVFAARELASNTVEKGENSGLVLDQPDLSYTPRQEKNV